jgi:hypothetical protein
MNGFLLNMINRHQGTVDRVQPRIRSMFEPESTLSVLSNNGFESNSDATVQDNLDTRAEKKIGFSKSPENKSISENPLSSPLPISLQHPSQPDQNIRSLDQNSFDPHRIDMMNEQIQGLIQRLSKKSETTEPLGIQNNQLTSDSSEITDHSTNQAASKEIGLSNQLEETLNRLKNQTRILIHTETEPVIKTIINHAHVDEQPINSMKGALRIPAWLTDLQTNLNNRWQELNTQSQPEPIINVTIGRVEVRATNPEPSKQRTASEKPKGVLSLDEYLKQRESKRRT